MTQQSKKKYRFVISVTAGLMVLIGIVIYMITNEKSYLFFAIVLAIAVLAPGLILVEMLSKLDDTRPQSPLREHHIVTDQNRQWYKFWATLHLRDLINGSVERIVAMGGYTADAMLQEVMGDSLIGRQFVEDYASTLAKEDFDIADFVNQTAEEQLRRYVNFLQISSQGLAFLVGWRHVTAQQVLAPGAIKGEAAWDAVADLIWIFAYVLYRAEFEPEHMFGFWKADFAFRGTNLPPWNEKGLREYLAQFGSQGIQKSLQWIRAWIRGQ